MKLLFKTKLLTALVCSCVALAPVPGKAAEPAPLLPEAPSPLPAFPSGFGTFQPPVNSAIVPASTTPAFAEWTRSVGPGDTVVLTGNKLSSYSSMNVGRDSSFLVYAQPSSSTQGVTAEADIQRLSGDQLALTLPSSLPANSLYLIWPKNEAGTGRPAVLNRTDPWWIGPNVVSPGKSFSVFGRNLGSLVYLQSSSGSGQWLTATASNSYKADYTLPSGASAGAYKVWAHNGLGAEYGWGKPLNLTVTAPYVWTTTQFNVKTQYGAVGDGVTDDTVAIRNAMTAANASPGSTLLFPAGTYIMNSGIWMNDGFGQAQGDMKWVGAGKSLTKIVAGPNYSDQYGLFEGNLSNVQIQDMTFDTGGSMSLVPNTVRANTLFRIRNSSNARFDNVRFTQEHDPASTKTADTSPIDFDGSNHMFFSGCEFVETNGAFSGNSQQVFFNACAFYGINDANALLYVWNGAHVSVTNCTAADFNSADVRPNGNNGWGQGRFFTGRCGTDGATHEIYFGGNTTTDMAVRAAYTANQNTGEQFLLEGMDTIAQGQATGGTSNSVTVPGTGISNGANQIATIVAGRGVGQSRLISAGSGGTFTVSEPWNVIPDSTSSVCIGSYLDHIAVVGNSFDGKAVIMGNHTASSGIQPFGGSSNFVAVNNTFHDLRYGIANWSILNTTPNSGLEFQPNFFNDFSGNTMTNCVIGIRNNVGYGLPNAAPSGAMLLGNRVRGNNISATENGIDFWSENVSTSNHSVGINLFQGNTINAKRGWVSNGYLDPYFTGNYPGMENEVLVGNSVQSNGSAGATLNVANEQPAFRQNTWTPGGSAYSGTATGILEMPRRVVRLDLPGGTTSASGTFTVWNSGTGALSWTASTATPWLQLGNTSGSIADERNSNTLNFTVNATGLSTGTYTGVISVSGAGKTQQVTVIISVSGSTPPGAGTGAGLKGEYYSGASFDTFIRSQIDPRVNFDWGWGNPTNLNGSSMSSIDINNFSVRWTGQVQAIESGTYTFYTTSDDGARLWISDINGTPLIDKWNTQAATSWSGTVTLVAGQKYNIRMDYFEGYDLAEARLSWLRPGASASEIVPQSQLYPTLGTAGGTGTITREVWTSVEGNDVVAIPTGTTPNSVSTLTSLESPSNWADSYGQRLRGTITAPTSGNYTFWISGDDATELWLGTNSSASSKVKIAYNTLWTSIREWNKYTTQKSATISLVAGQKYYVEVLHKEGSSGDNLAVGWLKPGESGTVPSEIVPGSVLSPLP